ncbi:hypothetical protein L207DRAFT_577791 [Hyaloscypha variabilis F]|uniref:2EXR domain-containing protein n=1 Tax=Hyaloscypha variabilis (strain UAMH 11265 / GT02V1 / F) TaxID=1149755 RepID=A0A2J6S270_HYAVF|nr:hypothetical protein L207DRAFT_577791 [Hyaloscypha variabilis F]
MANIGGSNGIGQGLLMDFTVFPELPVEPQLKIWKLAVPSPTIMQTHTVYPSYRNAYLSKPTDEQLCDMEVVTPGRELQFGTTTPASS